MCVDIWEAWCVCCSWGGVVCVDGERGVCVFFLLGVVWCFVLGDVVRVCLGRF